MFESAFSLQIPFISITFIYSIDIHQHKLIGLAELNMKLQSGFLMPHAKVVPYELYNDYSSIGNPIYTVRKNLFRYHKTELNENQLAKTIDMGNNFSNEWITLYQDGFMEWANISTVLPISVIGYCIGKWEYKLPETVQNNCVMC